MATDMTRNLLAIAAVTLLLGACKDPVAPAKVTLSIDGVRHDYDTGSAEYDQQGEETPYSVYLLRDAGSDKEPYLGIRYYSGNPVAHLWLRYQRPGSESSDLATFECFVPGKLSDGRPTLGWTQADGKPRTRQETGEEGCNASVSRSGDQLTVTFDARVTRRGDEPGEGGKGAKEPVHVEGSATLTLR